MKYPWCGEDVAEMRCLRWFLCTPLVLLFFYIRTGNSFCVQLKAAEVLVKGVFCGDNIAACTPRPISLYLLRIAYDNAEETSYSAGCWYVFSVPEHLRHRTGSCNRN